MAVYTHISVAEASAFCDALYDLPPVRDLAPIAAGTDNTNYILHMADKTRYILTLFESRMSPARLPGIFTFAEIINDTVINAPAPVRTKTGEGYALLNGKHAALVRFLSGQSIHRPDPQHCGQIGGVLAQMHRTAAQSGLHLPPNEFHPAAMKDLFKTAEPSIHRYDPALVPLITGWLDGFQNTLPLEHTLPRGAVHADLFPDNVFFEYDKISGIFDFYFACTDTFLYDMAVTVNAWCFDEITGGTFLPGHFNHFMTAYQQHRRPTADEKSYFPVMGAYAALRIALTRLRDYYPDRADIIFTPRDPAPYINIVKFHQNYGATLP